jgi:antirestriction protein ArdC
MEDHRYRPDAAFARNFAAEAAIATDSLVSTTVETAPVVEALEPKTSFLTFEPVSEKQQYAAALIEQGVEHLLADPNSFYRFAGKFHRYSIPNQLLIMTQKPDATKVASFAKWKELGRTVNRGERGLAIFYPMFGKQQEIVDPITGEVRKHQPLVGFGVGSTFDISQTSGRDLPEEPTVVDRLGETEGAKDIDRRGVAYGLGQGLTMTKIDLGTARGVYAPGRKTIGINTELPFGDILTTKTLLHELAHFADDHILNGDRRDQETVAESAAFITMAHFGMDTSPYSHHYLAMWAQEMPRLRANLGDAQKIATKLITALEGEKPEEVPEWL